MHAVIKNPNSNGRNLGNEKNLDSVYTVVAVIKSKLHEVLTVKVYTSKSKGASTVHASLWLSIPGGLYCSGTGSASGWGYHKESEAIARAIESAGVELFGNVYSTCEWNSLSGVSEKEHKAQIRLANKTKADIGGCGDNAVTQALTAIVKAAGCRGQIIVCKN